MKRVAEIIYIVEEQREEFLKGILNPDEETQTVQWLCGVRKQQYFALNDLIFMTFEYKGNDFTNDMSKMAAYLDSRGYLVKKRRKDVPAEERTTTNWWAPVKKMGTFLEEKPSFIDDSENQDYVTKLDGSMIRNENNDIAYADEDWMDDINIWKYM